MRIIVITMIPPAPVLARSVSISGSPDRSIDEASVSAWVHPVRCSTGKFLDMFARFDGEWMLSVDDCCRKCAEEREGSAKTTSAI